jgi:tryptophan 2,3-dioxygenase
MVLLAILAAAEASFLSASWFQRARMKRQELLLGKETRSLNIPFIDKHLAKQADHATRFQTFAARQLAVVFRQVVHTRAFELLVLKLIQSASRQSRRESGISTVEVIL